MRAAFGYGAANDCAYFPTEIARPCRCNAWPISAGANCWASQPEHQPKAIIYSQHCCARQRLDAQGEQCAIEGYHLRYVHYRCFVQSRLRLAETEIPRGVGERQIRRNYGHHYGRNAAFIERIALHDENRPTKSGPGTHWLRQRGPPDLTTFHDQWQLVALEPRQRLRSSLPMRRAH